MTKELSSENGLKIFDNPEFGKVRVVIRDSAPYFVARDVCEILEIQNTADAVDSLDLDEKTSLATIDNSYCINNINDLRRDTRLISESGLYSLVFKSRKSEAKKFRKWVTNEVLPTIRKTGQYGGYNLPRIPASYSDALRMIADIEDEKNLAIEQRDYYKRTKAEINDRKVATAMNTASIAVRQRDKLANEIGNGKKWKEVKAIPWLLNIFAPSKAMYIQIGKRLAALSVEMGYEVRRKETSEYPNGIGIYHIDVIDAFHTRLLANPEMLGKYRIDDMIEHA